jgi:hypothetical protein
MACCFKMCILPKQFKEKEFYNLIAKKRAQQNNFKVFSYGINGQIFLVFLIILTIHHLLKKLISNDLTVICNK